MYERLTDDKIDKETKKKLIAVLCDIKRRCLNPEDKYFYLYGDRGITLCEEWSGKDGHKNFREWAVNNGYKKGLSIDRIDNNKGYSPENCRWATARQQAYNRRSNKLVTIHGKTQTVTEWAKEAGLPLGTFQNRLRAGWDEDRLLGPKEVVLKMTKHEFRVEVLKLRKEVEEYKQKIDNGKLIELPCAVEDTVYLIAVKRPCYACWGCSDWCHKDCKYTDKGDLVVKEATVEKIELEKNWVNIKCRIEETNSTINSHDAWRKLADFGKTVFLTPEEANKKLKELENEQR